MVEKRRGRPLKDDARRNQVKVYLNDDELKMLEKLAGNMNTSKSGVVSSALIVLSSYREGK